jgi:membrane-associated phospholipid phosphatase
MNFLTKLQKEEKAVCIYLSLGVLFFLFFDYSISKFFYNINSQTKSLFETLTHFGDSLYFFVPTILIWATIKIIQNKNKIILTISDISIFIFFNILFSGIAAQIFKHILGRPRPPLFHSNNLSTIDIFNFDSRWHSFPSGHTTTIFAFIFCLIFLFPKIKNILIAIAVVIASTRVIVGAHYVSDIFGGALVAYITSILLREKFFQKSKLFKSDQGYLISNESVNLIYNSFEKKLKSIFSLYLSFNFYLKILATMLALSIIFFLFPNIDITVSGLFFGQDGSFLASEQDWFIYFIRKMILPLLALLVFFIPIAAAVKQYIYGEKILNKPLRDWTFLFSCLVLGTGVIVNSIFKSFWGRARPNDTIVFGGEQPFTIPWLNVDYCESNCSFVSGDVSFFTLSLAILLIFNKQTWNIFAYSAIILISLLRIMEGDHFLSDTIMSFIITYLVIRALYDLFQLLPEDLNLKRKIKLKRT